MFWLSCEVLYSLDQKHMKQGCYIDNTTESLFQHGGVFACFSFSVVSLFVLMYVPRLLFHPRFLSICAGMEGRSYFRFLCCTEGGVRTMYNSTENNTRGSWLTNLASYGKVQWHWEPTIPCESLYGFRKPTLFAGFILKWFKNKAPWIHLDSFLAFHVII